MENRVLFVDDEVSVLEGYRRILHREFSVTTATGGEQGLAAIRASGPFAVVVSDMRMPGMTGAQFLASVREKSPESVRMLLTGYSDLDAAIEAVNRGNIFRYLTKPCEKETLIEAIQSGVAQYNAAHAEKELVKKAQLVRSSLDWEARDIPEGKIDELAAGLPDSSEAHQHLEHLFATDHQGYVVLVKLSILKMIEDRYGPVASSDYIRIVSRSLMPAMGPHDRLFSWHSDVLMLVIRQQLTPTGVRIQMARLMDKHQIEITGDNAKQIMVAAPSTFEILPVSNFKSLDDMLAVFNAKLTGTL